MKYDREKIKELASQVNLLEYASRHYFFKRAGGNWYTNCPLHQDDTPSLSINEEDNYFYCFSCKRGGSIIQWFQYFEGLSYDESVQKLCRILDTSLDECKVIEHTDTMNVYEKLIKKPSQKKRKEVTREILDDSAFDRFDDDTPAEWVAEGIDADVMKKFNIRIDNRSNRIVYPVYDADLNLIGFKGRTRFSDYKTLGIMKYQNYNKIGTTDFFAGMKENKENIIKKNEVIIFEGIKSVMKVYPWGYTNCLAAETSKLNDKQIEILIKMHIKNIIIAFDSDVDINSIVKNLSLLRMVANVYVIKNKHNLLDNKMSPCDKGKDVFDTLYEERVRI